MSSQATKPLISKSNPPPKAPAGGQWGSVKYAGDKTNCFCVVLCLLTGIFSGCGTCAYLCPMDEKDGYKHGDKVYDAHGRIIGRSQNLDFKPYPARN